MNSQPNTSPSLRYKSTGELHRDFHASILDGVNYVRDNYGEEALREVLFDMGTKVYRTIHEKLVAGDPSELIAWWRYYLDREGSDYTLDETADGAVLTAPDGSDINAFYGDNVLFSKTVVTGESGEKLRNPVFSGLKGNAGKYITKGSKAIFHIISAQIKSKR